MEPALVLSGTAICWLEGGDYELITSFFSVMGSDFHSQFIWMIFVSKSFTWGKVIGFFMLTGLL